MQKHEVHLERRNGIPVIVADGEPIPMLAMQFFAHSQFNGPWKAQKMGEIHTRLFFLSIQFDDPEKQDDVFRLVHERVRELKAHVPDALVIPWIEITAYDGIAEKYPDAMIRFDNGETGGWQQHDMMRLRDNNSPRPSFASDEWRAEVGGMLKRFVQEVNQTELSDTIIGYFTFSHSYEWSHYWDFDSSVKCTDFSPAMQQAFKKFLIHRYAGNLQRLREAWKDPDVTFETACIPSFAQRTTTDYGWFWDPTSSRQVQDYIQCNADVVADSLEYYSSILKKESGRKALVGAFWGYCMNTRTLWGGQNRFKELLNSPDIDFWAAPNSYENRSVGDFASMRFMVKTLQRHNKLWFVEIDTNYYDRPATPMFPLTTKEESCALFKRDFLYPLCEGTQAWWIDWAIGDAPFAEDGFWDVTQRMGKIRYEAQSLPMGGISDIAAVIDQESLLTTTQTRREKDPTQILTPPSPVQSPEDVRRWFPSHLMYNAIERFRIQELPRIGTPVDFYETDDILDGGDRAHKMYIFLNNYRMDSYERIGIAKHLKKDGNVLVFMYAAGLLCADRQPGAGPENITDLTGIHMKAVMQEQRSRIRLTDAVSQYFPDLCGGTEIGDFERMIACGDHFGVNQGVPFLPEPCSIHPVFVCDDPDAVVLGEYVYGGQPAMILKKMDGWTSIYIGSPMVQATVLRSIAKYAKAHLFVDGEDIVYANESYLGIHTNRDGERIIHLKKPADVSETFEQRPIAQNVSEFTEYIPKYATRLYRLDDPHLTEQP